MGSSTSQLLTADERLALIQVKIERAKKHIIDVQGEVAAFFRSKPYEIVAKKDSQSGKVRYYLTRLDPVPFTISALTGDAIQNLRSALDHLAHQLLLVNLGVTATDGELNFLIKTSARDYEAFLGRPKRLRQDAIDALLSVQAYKGGKGHQLWVLNRLNNIDKHRLILTVAAASGGAIISNRGTGREIEQEFGLPPGTFPVVEAVLNPAQPQVLKVGDEVFIANIEPFGHFDPQKEGKFHFHISFNEPQILEGGPLLETLNHFTDLVSNTVTLFKPCLS